MPQKTRRNHELMSLCGLGGKRKKKKEGSQTAYEIKMPESQMFVDDPRKTEKKELRMLRNSTKDHSMTPLYSLLSHFWFQTKGRGKRKGGRRGSG